MCYLYVVVVVVDVHRALHKGLQCAMSLGSEEMCDSRVQVVVPDCRNGNREGWLVGWCLTAASAHRGYLAVMGKSQII